MYLFCSPYRPFYSLLAQPLRQTFASTGLDIGHLVYMPIGHMVLKISVSCNNSHMPGQYLYKPCKAYAHCWENKYMSRLKNHLPSWACNHKSLCALGQDLHALGIWAHLNVKPCCSYGYLSSMRLSDKYMHQKLTIIGSDNQWLITRSAPRHYLNQCWYIINWTLRNKLQWNFNWNSYIFIQENAFENLVWKMVAILSQPQCVTGLSVA